MNNINTFTAVAPPDGKYIYDQETDIFSLTDQYYINDSIYSIEIPRNTKFIIIEDMVRFNIKVPIFYFLNSAINNFRMVNGIFELLFTIFLYNFVLIYIIFLVS